MEIQGEAHLPAILTEEKDLRLMLVKDLVLEQFRRGHHLVGHMLVLGQGADEVQDQRAVPGDCFANGDVCQNDPSENRK